MRKITIIDDNTSFADTLSYELTRRGYSVQSAHTGATGLALVARESPRLVVLDLHLPDMDGIEVLRRIKRSSPEIQVVIATAYPQFSTALAGIKSDVVDYLCKPFHFTELDAVLDRAFARESEPEILPAHPEPAGPMPVIEMIGPSAASVALRALIRQLAASGVRAVLVTGESGTGKDLVAGMLHAEGPRRQGPFVEVNCSAISETLFESELFGHERGAFTGAVGLRRGLVEAADGGTLFLDEIAETPLPCQAKLLRFLDDQTFMRVGGSRKARVDVRIITATNRDLKAMVADGTFRADLYYRLHVAAVTLMPLRLRPDDILPLVAFWLRHSSARHGRRDIGVTREVEELFLRYAWPGNVRELRNLVERLVILCPDDRITAAQLPDEFFKSLDAPAPPPAEFLAQAEYARNPEAGAEAAASLDELGHAHIRRVLAMVNGNKTKAAEILGISRQTLRSKLSSTE
jgi:two-component system, NtrC family, response regulator AtoC